MTFFPSQLFNHKAVVCTNHSSPKLYVTSSKCTTWHTCQIKQLVVHCSPLSTFLFQNVALSFLDHGISCYKCHKQMVTYGNIWCPSCAGPTASFSCTHRNMVDHSGTCIPFLRGPHHQPFVKNHISNYILSYISSNYISSPAFCKKLYLKLYFKLYLINQFQ